MKHGLAADASEYPWCSMRWVLDVEEEDDYIAKVLAAKTDRVRVKDDF